MRINVFLGMILVLISGLFLNSYLGICLIFIGFLTGFLSKKIIQGFIDSCKSAFIGILIMDIIFVLYINVIGAPLEPIAGGIGGFTISGTNYWIPVIKQLILDSLVCGVCGCFGGIIRKVI